MAQRLLQGTPRTLTQEESRTGCQDKELMAKSVTPLQNHTMGAGALPFGSNGEREEEAYVMSLEPQPSPDPRKIDFKKPTEL